MQKDIIFKKRVELPIREIERIMPDIKFTAYTEYKLRFNDVPADYSEVYAYVNENELEIIKKRLEKVKTSEKNPNIFLLKKDDCIDKYEKIPLCQIFVDLWNVKEWYAKDFLAELEKRMRL